MAPVTPTSWCSRPWNSPLRGRWAGDLLLTDNTTKVMRRHLRLCYERLSREDVTLSEISQSQTPVRPHFYEFTETESGGRPPGAGGGERGRVSVSQTKRRGDGRALAAQPRHRECGGHRRGCP